MSSYVIYQYLETGLEFLLLPPLFIAILRLKNNLISYNSLVCIVLLGMCTAPTFITGGYLFGVKLIYYVVIANYVTRANLFAPDLFLLAFLINVLFYFMHFINYYSVSEGISVFQAAPNYFVFIVSSILLMMNLSPILTIIVTFPSFSRWNIVSLISAYSWKLGFMLFVAAFVNLIWAGYDTSINVKVSSDGDRLNLLYFQLETLDEYIIGKPSEIIKLDIHHRASVNTDTFEGIIFDAYSLFGVFGLFLLLYHFRLLQARKYHHIYSAAIYIFMFPFFNPVIYSFAYYLFAEHILNKSSTIEAL